MKTRLKANAAPLSPEELQRRQPVWEAFSEFWLDTELDSSDHTRIANVLRAGCVPLNVELRLGEAAD